MTLSKKYFPIKIWKFSHLNYDNINLNVNIYILNSAICFPISPIKWKQYQYK